MKPDKGVVLSESPQKIYRVYDALGSVGEIIAEYGAKHPFLVCGSSARRFPLWGNMVDSIGELTVFSNFGPNPTYDSVVEGAELFKSNGCDFLISIGGGSAMDVAKAVKLFSAMDDGCDYLTQSHKPSNVVHLAVPTTAGTGSESTAFSVIYRDGDKKSLENPVMIPDIVLLDAALLATLPEYQKKCAFLDAMGQCIESIWAVGANDESQDYAQTGLKLLLEYADGYFRGDVFAAQQVHLAANFSGRAINISKTTAAHAMSYGITALCKIPHGHAVAMALPVVWQELLVKMDKGNTQNTNTKSIYLALDRIDRCFGAFSHTSALSAYLAVYKGLSLARPAIEPDQIIQLAQTVNLQRLKNMPVQFSQDEIHKMYNQIFYR